MSDPFLNQPDLSPSLGGTRAQPEEPVAEPTSAAQDAPSFTAGPASNDPLGIRSELEEIFGAEGAEVLEALTQATAFGQGLSSLFTSTLQALETQLPQVIGAFEGLVEAVGQAVDQALEPLADQDEQA